VSTARNLGVRDQSGSPPRTPPPSPGASLAVPAASDGAEGLRLLLVGNPNAGKTTLFNRWTGGRARVGNYPGVTVDVREGRLPLPGSSRGPATIVDLPGTYSLRSRSFEERLAVEAFLGAGLLRPGPSGGAGGDPGAAMSGASSAGGTVVVVVVDGTALGRSLYLAQQVVETGLPSVVAVNLVDELRAEGRRIDAESLSRELGVPVVPVSARSGEGLDRLRTAALEAATPDGRARAAGAAALAEQATPFPPAAVDAVDRVAARIEAAAARPDRVDASGGAAARPSAGTRSLARWALLTGEEGLAGLRTGGMERPSRRPSSGARGQDASRDPSPYRPAEWGAPHLTDEVLRAVAEVHAQARADGRDLDLELVAARYARVDELAHLAVTLDQAAGDSRSTRRLRDRLDAWLTHRVVGVGIFAVVMALMFQALFTWSEPLMGAVEAAVAAAQGAVGAAMPEGPLRGLLVDGVLGGVGNVVVFVPQIALLFLFIGFLEDSGYLARVAFVIDRLMGAVGLHGRAFVPMLSGFACAVPAVMATRTLESRRDRLLTMLVIPLMSCSARLPVYVLITATVFAADARVFGVLSLGAVVLFAMYALSVLGALGAAAVLRRTVLRGPRPTLVLELPPLRWPVLVDLLRSTWDRVRSFLVDAGTIILALTVVLWALLSYPVDPAVMAEFEGARVDARTELEGDALDAELDRIANAEASARLRGSAAGTLGRSLEPALEPLGFDWRLGVGIIGAFAAREVFVTTLGIVFGAGDAVDETSSSLRDELRQAEWPDGRPLLTPLVGISLMVFFVFAAQCMSTLAVIRRESGSFGWAAFVFVYMTGLAWAASLLVYQGGQWLGLAGGAG